MPTVKLWFPGGRYHATPWGHHVNEGLIEWPPSPWRLLRALVATGFTKLGWSDVPLVARRLIDKLAEELPFYRLPTASAAHSRHYMPIGSLEKGREKTTLVFDTWANVGKDALLIHWPCELNAEEFDLLRLLVSSLSYLGRSESWVGAQLMDEVPADWNAVPCQEGEPRGPGWEQVSLMAAIAPVEYNQWREEQVQQALQPFQKQKQTPANKKKQARAIEPYPPDLLSCLTKDTAWWKGHGWSQPPGSRRVLYWRRSDALEVSIPAVRRHPVSRRVTAMLLAISTTSGNRSALPPVARTLPQAEMFHRAIVGRLGNGQRVKCPELTGKDESGRPLHDHHEHAHTIPVDLDGDGRLDHILIYAKMGLGQEAQRAIRSLRRAWTKGGVGELQLAVVGSGDIEILRKLPSRLQKKICELLGPQGGSCNWESVTPFVPPRFPKKRGKNTLEGQVQAELSARNLPPATVEINVDLTRDLRHFIRRRAHGGVPPKLDAGFGVRLRFPSPIYGPLLLGYASHYGLGLFRAC